MSGANSQTLSISDVNAHLLTFTAWFDWLFIENTSGGALGLYVRSDGVTAVGSAAGCLECQPGQEILISNQLPRPNPNQTVAQRFAGLGDTTHQTQLSVICPAWTSTAATVTVTAQ